MVEVGHVEVGRHVLKRARASTDWKVLLSLQRAADVAGRQLAAGSWQNQGSQIGSAVTREVFKYVSIFSQRHVNILLR